MMQRRRECLFCSRRPMHLSAHQLRAPVANLMKRVMWCAAAACPLVVSVQLVLLPFEAGCMERASAA